VFFSGRFFSLRFGLVSWFGACFGYNCKLKYAILCYNTLKNAILRYNKLKYAEKGDTYQRQMSKEPSIKVPVAVSWFLRQKFLAGV